MNDFFVIAAIIGCVVLIANPSQAGELSWQERTLFSPSPAQLTMEQDRGRIMIYEGMKDVQVAMAMDRQFDRIEHMMFVGTVVTDGQGNVQIDPETGQIDPDQRSSVGQATRNLK